jgi:hypothetical protein
MTKTNSARVIFDAATKIILLPVTADDHGLKVGRHGAVRIGPGPDPNRSSLRSAAHPTAT